MKTEMIQSFMLKNGECFDSSIVMDVQKKLENVDDSKAALVMSLNLQKPTFILVIAILFGWERFFSGRYSYGYSKDYHLLRLRYLVACGYLFRQTPHVCL